MPSTTVIGFKILPPFTNKRRPLVQNGSIHHDLTTALITEYVALWVAIQSIQWDPTNNQHDEIIWTRTASGEYSACSAYKMQFDGGLGSWFPAKVWAPARCKTFLWLLLEDRVWTAARLQRRHWPNQYLCPLCRRNLETAFHLFAECPFSHHVWDAIGDWLQLANFKTTLRTDTDDIAKWFESLTDSSRTARSKGTRSLAILVCWAIWKQRNARIFENKEKTEQRLIAEIKDEVPLWIAAGAKDLSSLVSSNSGE